MRSLNYSIPVGFEVLVWCTPAFDRRHPSPSQDYGIHGVELAFALKGPEGATVFTVFTNWQLPHVTKEFDAKATSSRYPHLMCKPMAADLGYHRLTPSYEGQDTLSDECELLNGRPCYYDGSGLMAEDVFTLMLSEGDVAIWHRLEEFYRENVLSETEVR